MKRFMFVSALALAIAVPVVAEVFIKPTLAPCSNPYVVREGNSLWRIAETQLRNPLLWKQLLQRNPFLSEPGRVTRRENGWVYVMILPGEFLCGVNQNGEVDANLLNDNIVSSAAANPAVVTKVAEKTFSEKASAS